MRRTDNAYLTAKTAEQIERAVWIERQLHQLSENDASDQEKLQFANDLIEAYRAHQRRQETRRLYGGSMEAYPERTRR